jgi:hypothetical protein
MITINLFIIFFLFISTRTSFYWSNEKGKTFFYIRPLIYSIRKKKKLYTYYNLKFNKKGEVVSSIYKAS